MPDYWSVPIDNSLYMGLDSQIAKGPDFSWIGNLPNAYWQGQQAQYTNRNQNAFPTGLPTLKKPDGTPATDANGNPIIDYSAIGNTLAKAGGASQIGPAVGMAAIPAAQTALQHSYDNTPDQQSTANGPQPQGTIPPNTGATISSGRPQPQTTDQSLTPQQVAQANPNGTPQPVAMPQGGAPQQQGGGTTPRMLSQQTGVDPQAIATAAGVPIDQPIPTDPQTRQNVYNVLKQSAPGTPNNPSANAPPPNPGVQPQGQPQPAQVQPQGAPGQVQTMPQGGQPGQNLQPGSDQLMARANAARSAGDQLASQAAALAMNPYTKAASDAVKARADAAYKAADQYRDAALSAGKPTNEQLNARDQTVQQTSIRTAADTKAATDDQEGFDKDTTGLNNAARTASGLSQRITLAKNLTLNPTFYSGPFHEGVESYQQFKSVFGQNPSAATPMEAFHKVTNDILADSIKAMAQSGVGRVNLAEVNIMRQGIASLGITAQTDRAQLEIANRLYAEQQQFAQIANQVKSASSQIPPGQRETALNNAITAYQQSHPLFTDQEKAQPELLGAPDAPPASAQWSPQQKQNWAQSVGLKAGDPVRFNGQIAAVP